jgi:hypothetical protein
MTTRTDELTDDELNIIYDLVADERSAHDNQLKLLARKHKLTGVDQSAKQYHSSWSAALGRILDKMDEDE